MLFHVTQRTVLSMLGRPALPAVIEVIAETSEMEGRQDRGARTNIRASSPRFRGRGTRTIKHGGVVGTGYQTSAACPAQVLHRVHHNPRGQEKTDIKRHAFHLVLLGRVSQLTPETLGVMYIVISDKARQMGLRPF